MLSHPQVGGGIPVLTVVKELVGEFVLEGGTVVGVGIEDLDDGIGVHSGNGEMRRDEDELAGV